MSFNLNPKHLHHAYLLEGERSVVLQELLDFLEREKVVPKGSPDLHVYEFDAMGIADAHRIRSEQSLRAYGGEKKIFVVSFASVSSEAQNALLKTLEEPTPGTHFFIVARQKEMLLPTVRSRLVMLSFGAALVDSEEGESFLDADMPERFRIIERFTKAKTDDRADAKEGTRAFLDALERALHPRAKDDARYASSLEHVLVAKRYLSDRAPSLKIILEHLALTVPTR